MISLGTPKRSAVLVGFSVFALLLIGCDRKSQTKDNAGSAAAVAHPATITGRVVFSGKPPELPRLNTSAVPTCNHPGGLPDESIVIGDKGAMANVFVYLKEAPKSSGASKAPAVLDQEECQYVPHVVALQTGESLKIKSSDPMLHNVDIAEHEPPINVAYTGQQEHDFPFNKAGFYKVKCDVHPWMTSWVGVFDSPCYAVTGEDGTFKITGVPPGSYTLVAWQEKFGEQKQAITVGADGAVKADFEYK
jgi:plastocyanin